jgi:hypothetical protein
VFVAAEFDENGNIVDNFGTDGVYETGVSGGQCYGYDMVVDPTTGDIFQVGKVTVSGSTEFMVVEYNFG